MTAYGGLLPSSRGKPGLSPPRRLGAPEYCRQGCAGSTGQQHWATRRTHPRKRAAHPCHGTASPVIASTITMATLRTSRATKASNRARSSLNSQYGAAVHRAHRPSRLFSSGGSLIRGIIVPPSPLNESLAWALRRHWPSWSMRPQKRQGAWQPSELSSRPSLRPSCDPPGSRHSL